MGSHGEHASLGKIRINTAIGMAAPRVASLWHEAVFTLNASCVASLRHEAGFTRDVSRAASLRLAGFRQDASRVASLPHEAGFTHWMRHASRHCVRKGSREVRRVLRQYVSLG